MRKGDAFYIGYSKPYAFFVLILCAGFVYMCYWGFLYSDRSSELVRGIILSVCAIFALSGILICIRRLFTNSFFMKISHQGIIFRPWSDQIILWQDIQSIFVYTMDLPRTFGLIKMKSLGISLIDPENNSKPNFYFKMRNLNKPFGADMFMEFRSCDKTIDEINEAIAHYSDQIFRPNNNIEE